MQRKFSSPKRQCGARSMVISSFMLHSTIVMSAKWIFRGFHQILYFDPVSMFTSKSIFYIFHTHTHTGGLTSKGTFPDSLNVRYPTPGTLNPEVTLWLLDLSNITDVQKYQLKEPISLEGQWVFVASFLFHSHRAFSKAIFTNKNENEQVFLHRSISIVNSLGRALYCPQQNTMPCSLI